jgi:hypothetical protein
MTEVGPQNVDLGKLQELYSRNKVAAAVLDHFAGRKYAMRETSVDRVLTVMRNQGARISRGELIEVFRNLEAAGCGTFVLGRRGRPSRFRWQVDLVSVGRAAAGEGKQIEDISDDAVEEETGEQTLTHLFQLRPDQQVSLELPRDLTPREASRLADFIRTLPFDAGAS